MAEYPAPVRRLGVLAVSLGLLAAAACGGGGGGQSDDAAAPPNTTSAPVATTTAAAAGATTTVAGSNLSLRMTDVRLANSEESDNAVRVLLPAGVTTATVSITGLPNPNRVISVCQANALDRRLPTAVCRMPAAGETATLPLGSGATGVEIIQVGVTGTGPAANTTTLDEVVIRYAAASRDVSVRLPQIEAGESGGRPSFGLTPAGQNGAYKAVLNWTVVQVFGGSPSNAQLEVVQGANSVNKASGGALEVQLTGNVPSGAGDAVVRATNIGSSALVNARLTLTLP